MVILYHSGLGVADLGYLGVDIFFVISGFLITRIIDTELRAGQFSFRDFYYRRMRRLLPAAYATILATAIASFYFLASIEARDFAWQVLGSLTFTANFVLNSQSGYFDGPAEMKPLLHMWSLAIEEQYYLLMPVLMAAVAARHRLVMVGSLTALSLALSFYLPTVNPSAAFYLLPTRAWELGIGSVLALARLPAPPRRVVTIALLAAGFVLAVVPVMGLNGHVMLPTLAVCLATAAVIAVQSPLLNTRIAGATLGAVGDASYSLYLAHWPPIAFLHNAYIGEPPVPAQFAAASVGVAFGVLLYFVIERPIRRANLEVSPKLVGGLLSASVMLALLPFSATLSRAGARDFSFERRTNRGFDEKCEFRGDFSPVVECRNSEHPGILIWGDSFAMHWVPGLASDSSEGIVQATRSGCGPFASIAPYDKKKRTRVWAESCISFNQSVLTYAAKSPVSIVVLAGTFGAYADTGDRWTILSKRAGTSLELRPSLALAINAMRETVETLRSMGKRVIVIAPTPSDGYDYSLCWERKLSGLATFGKRKNCRIDRARSERLGRHVAQFMTALTDFVPVLDFNPRLCHGDACVTEIDGLPIYSDSGHLSHEGSRILSKWLQLGNTIQAAAR